MTIRLRAGDASCAVEPGAGGRLASLIVGGRERLVTTEDPSALLPAVTWGSFAMLPWVGRMRDGRLSWRGTSAQLRRDFGAHAIHGTTYDVAWDVVAAGERSVELGCRLGASERWPFAGEARQRFELHADALELSIEVLAEGPMPVAAGWHPWFRRSGDEPLAVRVPAPAVIETTADLIPTGALLPVDGRCDLRRLVDVMGRQLDDAYVGVEGPSVVAWTDLELTIEAAPLRSVVVYVTPTSVCVEPQTAWPDAIRLAEAGADVGLAALAAGDTFLATSRWSWRAPQAAPGSG